MSISDKTTIKSYFKTGDIPTQSNFADLIDSLSSVQGEIPIELTYAASVGPNLTNGFVMKTTLEGDIELVIPIFGAEGCSFTWYITVDSSNRNLTLDANIRIPSDSGFTSPKTLDANKAYILQLRNINISGTPYWCLTSLVGGF